jgi:hypothetical protein
LAIRGPSGDTAHDATGGVAVDPLAVSGDKDRARAAFADREVDGPRRPGGERRGHDLAALADDGEGAVAPLESEVLDVGPDGLGDTESVEGQHTDQRVISCIGQAGGDQHGADLVAVQAGGVGLVVQPGPPHVRRQGQGDQAFLFRVAVEAPHGAQPPGDRGPGPPERLEVAGEALDVGAARTEHLYVMFGAPSDVLAQVERVGLEGEAAVAGQEPCQRQLLVDAERHVSPHEHGACRDGNVHGGTSKRRAEAPVAGTGQAAPAVIGSR